MDNAIATNNNITSNDRARGAVMSIRVAEHARNLVRGIAEMSFRVTWEKRARVAVILIRVAVAEMSFRVAAEMRRGVATNLSQARGIAEMRRGVACLLASAIAIMGITVATNLSHARGIAEMRRRVATNLSHARGIAEMRRGVANNAVRSYRQGTSKEKVARIAIIRLRVAGRLPTATIAIAVATAGILTES